jgi:transposase
MPRERESTKRGVGVLAGIDTHKDTLAVAVIDDAGRPVVVTEVANTEAGFDSLEELLTAHAVTRVGIEGSGNYGRGAAVRLVLAGGIEVVEVPPSLTSRERSGRPGAGKTDPVDAVAIARITAREPALPVVRLAVGQAADLRALADYRAQLVAERTALANRTHAELHGLLPGYQARIPEAGCPSGSRRSHPRGRSPHPRSPVPIQSPRRPTTPPFDHRCSAVNPQVNRRIRQ